MIDQLLFNNYQNQNHASVGGWLNSLYDCCTSELLVIRVDFIYRPEYRDQVSIDMVQQHRRRFLDNTRRNVTLFEYLLGYAWSLEYGVLTGFHQHFLLVYDGEYRRGDINLGLGIANYFDTVISKGWSHSYVSNTDKVKFVRNGTLGIGAIAHNDLDLRNNLLEHVAGYITKGGIDDSAREFLPEGKVFRTFGRSELPQARVSAVGRPRSTEVKRGVRHGK